MNFFNIRHRKRHRSDSTSNDYRSKSRTSRNDEKRSRTKSPKKRNSKPPKEDRRGDDKPTEEFASNLKEKELEAMLIAQKKVLDEMNSKNGDGQLELKENSSRERRKEENSNTADKLANDERNEGKDGEKLQPFCREIMSCVSLDKIRNFLGDLTWLVRQ